MTLDTPKTVFLDRDGVINQDSPDYIKSWEEFAFLPGSLEALRLLNERGLCTILVTNQSAVARRMLTIAELESLHQRMQDKIVDAGGRITDIFYCPHLPEEKCKCRKPRTGMIERAADKYGLELAQSVLVGDSAKDILCARQAAVGRTILVRTGNGLSAEIELAALKVFPDHVAADLLAAVRWIIDPQSQARPSSGRKRNP